MADQLMGLFTYIGVGVVIGGLAGVIVDAAVDPPAIVTGAIAGAIAAIAGAIARHAIAARMRVSQGAQRRLGID